MASSSPVLIAADLPSGEVPPNDRFTVEVEVRQESGPDPWLSSGACPQTNITGTGWVTPVSLWVNGEMKTFKKLCITPGAQKTVALTTSIPPGGGTLKVAAHQVGSVIPTGQTWKDNLESSIYDDMSSQVTTSTDAPDPSQPSSSDRVLMFINDIADAIGTSTNMVAIGIVVVAGVVLFL